MEKYSFVSFQYGGASREEGRLQQTEDSILKIYHRRPFEKLIDLQDTY